jgi:hypothetical protein
MEFLFVDFLYIFKKTFINDEDHVSQSKDKLKKKTHLTYLDKAFRFNMQTFLMYLEPRFYEFQGDFI